MDPADREAILEEIERLKEEDLRKEETSKSIKKQRALAQARAAQEHGKDQETFDRILQKERNEKIADLQRASRTPVAVLQKDAAKFQIAGIMVREFERKEARMEKKAIEMMQIDKESHFHEKALYGQRLEKEKERHTKLFIKSQFGDEEFILRDERQERKKDSILEAKLLRKVDEVNSLRNQVEQQLKFIREIQQDLHDTRGKNILLEGKLKTANMQRDTGVLPSKNVNDPSFAEAN